MSNPNELARARRKAAKSAWELAAIEALPRRKGQCVKWSNGVVWKRAGDGVWFPAGNPDWLYDSEHVASGDWSPATSSEFDAAASARNGSSS